MGADFAAGLRRSFIIWGAVIPLAIAIFLGVGGALSIVAGTGAMALVLSLAKSRIGGVTGMFGMLVKLLDALCCLLLSLVIMQYYPFQHHFSFLHRPDDILPNALSAEKVRILVTYLKWTVKCSNLIAK
jgi:hypothetical protein